MVEGGADDLEGDGNTWSFSFRFIGQRILDFDVFEIDRRGQHLNTQGRVSLCDPYVHLCRILVSDVHDITSAQLFIDSVSFAMLPVRRSLRPEAKLVATPKQLETTYGIMVPYKVRDGSTRSAAAHGSCQSDGFLASCCCPRDDDLQ